MVEASSRRIVVGQVAGAHGLRGWVRIRSYTDPREQILEYSPWMIRRAGEWVLAEVSTGRLSGRNVIAKLNICADSDDAEVLKGAEVAVSREQLPQLAHGEYYWTDLVGMRVVTRADVELGRVDRIMETGANDVLVVSGERERLIPFVEDQVVLEVDLAQGLICVDWDPED